MRKLIIRVEIFCFLLTLLSCKGDRDKNEYNADIIIYGGTSAAIISAVEAKRSGKSVIVVSPAKHLGGLSSSRLGFTDTGNKSVIGGLARDFYHRIFLHYRDDSTALGVAEKIGVWK